MLDTRVHTDPVACRATGQWLTDASNDLHAAGTVLKDARSASEEVWGGAAGEAFREHVRDGQDDADELSYSLIRTGGALTAFADDVDTVITTMTRARDVAAAVGLVVTPDGIEPPGPAPVAPTPMTPTSADLGSLDPVLAAGEHQRKVEAWTEVEATVAQARVDETAAHERLGRAVRDEQTLWDSIKGNSTFIGAEALLGTPAALQHANTTWDARARTLRADAASARAILDDHAATPAQRADALSRYLRDEGGARTAVQNAASNRGLLGPIARGPRVTAVLDILGHPLAKVPVVGWSVTGTQIASDVHAGKPVDRAVASAGAGLAAGTAASSAFTTAALAVGAAGGPVTLGAVAIGIGASALAGWAVDRYWEDIEDSAVGQAIADSPVGRAWDAIF